MKGNDDNSDFTDDFNINSSLENKFSGQSEPVGDVESLYFGPEANGFDKSHGGEWIYPTNYPVREYQKNIVANALFKNTLVCLPTGLGKTFIAAVIMYNFHRWYPKNIVVFMAHSKPLVAQQVNACCNIMGISPELISELNGNMAHASRRKQWDTKKIFFLTPQVFNNDLARGSVKAENIRCIVIDEAHKALGNQAYCQVIRSLKPFNSNFRVLALSATPGDDMNMVREVIQNLLISHLELRNEEDPDIKPYLHTKKIETVVVKLDSVILEVRDRFLKAVDKYIKPLVRNKILPQSFSSINPFSLVLKQKQFCQDPNVGPEIRGMMLSNFSVAISLFHALEELITHGLRSFLTKLKCMQTGEGSSNNVHHRLANDEDFKNLMDFVESYLGPDRNVSFDPNSSLTRIFDDIDGIDVDYNVVYSHPKFESLENIIREHFRTFADSTRVIVFCKSRQCTGEICNFLARFRPLVKPMIFIGQSQSKAGSVTKGFNQAAQLTVMKRFRDGIYNTLVATCVAEEGLDIGEVDLIINFDSGKNSNTQVQRSGRTGRKRDGRVVNLVTEGKEHQNYNLSISKGKKMNKRLVTDSKNLPFYSENPRLLPIGVDPVCQEMYFVVKGLTDGEGREIHQPVKQSRKKKLNDSRGEHGNAKKLKTGAAVDRGNGCRSFSDLIAPERSEGGAEGTSLPGKLNAGGRRPSVEILTPDGGDEMVVANGIAKQDVAGNPPETTEELLDGVRGHEIRGELFAPADGGHKKKTLKSFFQFGSRSQRTERKSQSVPVEKRTETTTTPQSGRKTNAISNLMKIAEYQLNEDDFDYLLESQLKVEGLVDKLNKSRTKLYGNNGTDAVMNDRDAIRVPSCRESVRTEEGLEIEGDVDFDDFLVPMEGTVLSSVPKLMSSTPLRKIGFKESDKENVQKTVTPKPDPKSECPDMSFQMWDDSDFFNLKDHSPKKSLNSTVDSRSSRRKDTDAGVRDSTMISISQALDIVKNAPSHNLEARDALKVKNDNECDLPRSPILFLSQRTKKIPRSKGTPSFPAFSQASNRKRSSRKCLTYTETDASLSCDKSKSDIFPSGDELERCLDAGAGEDLFAETEMALQDHLDKLELNLKQLEDTSQEAMDSRMKRVPSTVPPDDDDETVDYDLTQIRVNPDDIVDSFAKPEDPCTPTSAPRTESSSAVKGRPDSFSRTNKSGLAAEDYGINDLSNLFNSDCIFTTQFSRSCSVQSAGKKVRERSCESTRANDSVAKGSANGNQSKEQPVGDKGTNSKRDNHLSFNCSFSLFDDDDDDFGPCCNGNEGGRDRAVGQPDAARESVGSVVGLRNSHRRTDDDGSSDSDIFVRKKLNRNVNDGDASAGGGKAKGTDGFGNASEDDDDLSDGAIQAIRAVEEYERDEKLAKESSTPRGRRSPFELSGSSDDSDDPFLPISKHKPGDSGEKESKANRRLKSVHADKTKDAREFLNEEAVLSDCERASSDEEDGDELDDYDSSFVDEREVLTQAPDVDMTAKYLQSTKNLLGLQPGAFKIPKPKRKFDISVSSHVESEFGSQYEQDSFCVDDDDEDDCSDVSDGDITKLEMAVLGRRSPRKRSGNRKGSSRKRKFKRIRKLSDSSDDGSEAAKEPAPVPVPPAKNNIISDDSDMEEWFNSPFQNKTETGDSSSVVSDVRRSCGTLRSVVLIGSRQICECPEITTSLRARWRVIVHVRSTPEADYIPSWRVGINRITLSDFLSGSPKDKNSLRESVEKLLLNFQKPVLIVEDDKNRGLPNTDGCHRTMWSKHSHKTVAKFLKNNINVIFSKGKDDTARIVALLSTEECNKGHRIDLDDKEIPGDIEKKLKFCYTLPGINVANALRIVKKFPNLSSFIKACSCVSDAARELGVARDVALRVHKLLFSVPS